MSHIPNSAMPHAGGTTADPAPDQTRTLSDRASMLAESARAHPRTTAAAGAAVLASAVAAATIPLMRRKRSTTGRSKKSKSKS